MKRKRFSEEQIIKALKSNKAGIKVIDICRQPGIAEQTFYRWRSRYRGMEVVEAKHLRVLKAENSKLKQLLTPECICGGNSMKTNIIYGNNNGVTSTPFFTRYFYYTF